MNRFDLKDILQKWNTKKNVLAKKIGLHAHKFFLVNYDKEGFEDTSFQKWVPRKNRKNRKPLLVDTGRLRKSIKITSSSFRKITIGTNVPYGIYHNEGVPDRNLPQREFLGNSEKLEKEIYDMIQSELDNLFK